MPVGRVYEGYVDFLFAEECTVNPEFSAWVLGQTSRFRAQAAVLEDTEISLTDSDGESDIVLVFGEANSEKRLALLIENKVDAQFQPDQLGRYRKRGQTGILHGRWADFEVGLLSPARYRHGNAIAAQFDFQLSYEDVEQWLRARGDQRASFRADVLRQTANGASVYRRVADQLTDDFWGRIYDVCCAEFPELERKPIHVTKGSSWILFTPSDLPEGVSINFKNNHGFMDLTYNGWTESRLREHVAGALDGDMSVAKAGKSASVRIAFASLDMHAGSHVSIESVRAALVCARRLLLLFRRVGH